MRAALLLFACTLAAHAQWQILDAHTTADLRGVDNVGKGVVWASGTHGTVLRSEDNGTTWQPCTIPPDADKLDFRGIQAFDAKTAIVMSSGKGDLSRLYKTTDGCQTWKLVATNPEKSGFWDSFVPYSDCCGQSADETLILGDSVDNKLQLWEWKEGWEERELELSYRAQGSALPDEGSFAASNSVLQVATTAQVHDKWKYSFRWASGTPDHVFIAYVRDEHTATCEPCVEERSKVEVPMASGSSSGGIFSFFFRTDFVGIAVGGDFQKPAVSLKTCSWTSDGGLNWVLSISPPHGYRSSVAYDAATKTWITVGPNGTDISTDDGRNWRALKPGPGDAPDADQHWNALSLPFVVGPKGRIGMLVEGALVRK